jgi:orotate phosphoribosyltransferase
VEPKRLNAVPGTILRLWLPAHREQIVPRRSDNSAGLPQVSVISLGELEATGIQEASVERLRQLVGGAQAHSDSCVVALFEGGDSGRQNLEIAIRQCVEIRHPGMLILVGIRGGWELVEMAVDSVNKVHERERHGTEAHAPEHSEVWDPVLVLGPGGYDEFVWGGADPSYRRVLSELVNFGGSLNAEQFRNLLPSSSDRAAVSMALRADTALATITDDGGLQSRLGCVEDAISRYISLRLSAYVERGGEGVKEARGLYRTPTLHLVKKWIDVSTILDRTVGADLAIRALSSMVNAHFGKKIVLDFILTESTSQPHHVETLRRFQKAKYHRAIPSDTEAEMAPGIRLVQANQVGLVFLEIISSGDAALRCIHQILKDDAAPLAVACLFDARDTKAKSLNVAGADIPVIVLSPIDVSGDETNDIENINPITRQTEGHLNAAKGLRLTTKELDDLITDKNALHFSHIGRPIGRHFTFYLDATRLLQGPGIYGAFNQEIDEWKRGLELPDLRFDLWYPFPEPKPSAPARRIAQHLRNQRTDVTFEQRVRREPACGHWAFPSDQILRLKSENVVVVDWGAITGNSVMQMIRLAGQAGAKRVFVCIFLSQIPYEEETFLTSMHGLLVEQPVFTPPERDLLPTMVSKALGPVDVRVRFLGRFPVVPYPPYECSVCQTLVRLSEDDSPTQLLKEFVDAEQKRLNLRTREEVPDIPIDAYGRELPIGKTVRMAKVREELNAALTSTAVRYALARRIESWVRPDARKVDSDVDTILHLIALESHWLARPPLLFTDTRNAVGTLALARVLDRHNESGDRQNALTVLRASSAELFAKHFFDLFMSCWQLEELVSRLCHGAFTYLSRRTRESEGFYLILQTQIASLRKAIEDKRVQCNDHIVETLERLDIRANAETSLARVRSLTPAQAWLELHRALCVDYFPHKPVPLAIIKMLGPHARLIEKALSRAELGDDPANSLDSGALVWLRSLDKNWTKCREFLDYTILPLISKIDSVLRGEDCTLSLGAETVARLSSLAYQSVTKRKFLSDSDYSTLIRQTSRNPRRILDRRNWTFYWNETSWWAECVLFPA